MGRVEYDRIIEGRLGNNVIEDTVKVGCDTIG